MLVVGLTGSIGTGKSTTAGMFAARGIPVCDADAVVHSLYGNGGAAVGPVGAVFPDALSDGAIDRPRLAAAVFGDDAALGRLEAIVHPLVRRAQYDFLAGAIAAHARAAILEIPLLLETGGGRRCNVVIVTVAGADVQRQRVLERPGMTEEKFQAILARQMSETEKRRRAHFIVDTSFGIGAAELDVDDIMTALAPMPGWSSALILAQWEDASQ